MLHKFTKIGELVASLQDAKDANYNDAVQLIGLIDVSVRTDEEANQPPEVITFVKKFWNVIDSNKQTLTQENQTLTQEKTQLETDKQTLTQENQTLTQENQQLARQIDQLKQENANLLSKETDKLLQEEINIKQLKLQINAHLSAPTVPVAPVSTSTSFSAHSPEMLYMQTQQRNGQSISKYAPPPGVGKSPNTKAKWSANNL